MLAKLFAIIAAVLVFGATARAQTPNTSQDWRALALSDVDAMHALLRDNTPIPFDTINPAYPQWLEAGFERARQQVGEVSDAAGHFYLLAAYANGFRDPHISVAPTAPLPDTRWPGFVVAAKGEQTLVVYSAGKTQSDLSVGDVIEKCDDLPLPSLAAQRVFPFVFNPRLAVDRRRAITYLFLDRGNPFAPPPLHCDVRSKGALHRVALNWRTAPNTDPAWSAVQKAATGPSAPWGVSEPAPGVYWIGVPTFNSGPGTAPLLDRLLTDVSTRAAVMRQARAIVIDTRGNGGGNSAWADRLAVALFGEAAGASRRARNSHAGVDWRASAANIAYWTKWRDEVAAKEFGARSDSVRFAQRTIDGMSSALKRNPPLWRDGPKDPPPAGGLTAQRPRGTGPFPARVYFLSNGSCGSSCLNFADTVLMVPGVTLIGAATSGDGPYMDIRAEALPSGLVRLVLPQKVVRGMARGTLEAYEPDIAYHGDWSDAAVREWVKALISANEPTPPAIAVDPGAR